MMVSCKYCGRMHSPGTVCPKKPVRKNYGGTTRVRVWRSGVEWKKTREMIVDRDYHHCRVCETGEYGQFFGKYNSENLEVHHIVPLVEDWEKRTDEDNLITLCSYHHEMAERGDIPRHWLEELAASPPGFDL